MKTLKEYCKFHDLTCRYRTRGNYRYVTVGGLDRLNQKYSVNWSEIYYRIVRRYHATAKMTSGSFSRVTFNLGTVFDILKEEHEANRQGQSLTPGIINMVIDKGGPRTSSLELTDDTK